MLPWGKGVGQVTPPVGFEAILRAEETGVEPPADFIFREIYANENNLLPAVTPGLTPRPFEHSVKL